MIDGNGRALPPGLSNPEEFSFTTEEETSEHTMRRQHHARDQKRLDTLKNKLHTDDTCECVCVCGGGGGVCYLITYSKCDLVSFFTDDVHGTMYARDGSTCM